MKYYSILMANNAFVSAFNEVWKDELNAQNFNFKSSKQLVYGNRLRPLLYAWGNLLSSSPDKNLKIIAKNSLGVELIHKASIIVDDIVDDDNMRNGMPAFHTENSLNESIVYSNFLIARAIECIKQSCINEQLDDSVTLQILSESIKTVKQMTEGCLYELSSIENLSRYDVDNTKKIIDFETTTLIRNSLYFGFLTNPETPNYLADDIYTIGHNYGHIFQLFNDLEPFAKEQSISIHKGCLSADISGKNVAISLAYSLANKTEKNKLLKSEKSIELYTIFNQLDDKYHIRKLILDDIDCLINKTSKNLDSICKFNSHWVDDFVKFLSELLLYCRKKI